MSQIFEHLQETQGMASDKQVGLMYETWSDLDRVVVGLDAATATQSLEGGNSIAWSVAHVTTDVDSWINALFAGKPRHPVIGDPRFKLNGDGLLEREWQLILHSVKEVRDTARNYLEGSPPMDKLIPYAGSLEYLRNSGLTLRYAILRSTAHHYFHIGEISTKRDRLGHSVGDYPGQLRRCL